MAKWEGGIISKDANYRTVSENAADCGGIWGLDNQLRHSSANNWVEPPPGSTVWPDDDGQRVPITIVQTTQGADSADDYEAHYESFSAAYSAQGATGRLYLAVKCTSGNSARTSYAYYNDFCIGAVQLLAGGFSSLEEGWSFSVLDDYTSWEYATVNELGTTSAGYENISDILDAPSQTWASCIDSTANYRISRNSYTGSQLTGAADGVSTRYSADDATPILLDGDTSNTIAQVSLAKFMFTESSGTSSKVCDKWWWVRSPEVTLGALGVKVLAIVYHAYTRDLPLSGEEVGMKDAADNALLRWWWQSS